MFLSLRRKYIWTPWLLPIQGNSGNEPPVSILDHLAAKGITARGERLAGEQIGSEIYYPVPIHLQAALRDLGHKPGDFPQAERAAAEVLALPLYPELRDDEQQIVVAAIRAFYA